MTEEEKLKRGAEIRALWMIVQEEKAKMTPEELEAYYANEEEPVGGLAASFEEQERMEKRFGGK